MIRVLVGHVIDKLRELPAESVHCVVTSPPYYGLRDYGIEPQVWGDWRGSLGLEPTLALYLDHMVEVFREVRRVLRRDGTCWLNIGDSYAASSSRNPVQRKREGIDVVGWTTRDVSFAATAAQAGLKPKDLMLTPSRLAIALQDDGWWVRSDIAWCKRAPMPESCQDRPTSAWEHVFLLTRSARYYYDAEAVKEEAEYGFRPTAGDSIFDRVGDAACGPRRTKSTTAGGDGGKRNMRNFWLLGPEPFTQAHFATFPTEIPRRAILAGSKPGDTILDPFFGAGTTGLVADQLQRDCIGIEINPQYAAMAERRIREDNSLFSEVAAE